MSTTPNQAQIDAFDKQQTADALAFRAQIDQSGIGGTAAAQQKYKDFYTQQRAAKEAFLTGKPAATTASKAGESVGEGIKSTVQAGVNGVKAMLGFGKEAAHSVADGTADETITDAGKKTGEGIAGFFKDMDWKKLLGMGGGVLLAWLGSSVVGGGWLGTLVFALLAIPMALMGRDFADKTFGNGMAKTHRPDASGQQPAQEIAQGPQLSPQGPAFANQPQTRIGSVLPPQQPGNGDWIAQAVSSYPHPRLPVVSTAQAGAPLATFSPQTLPGGSQRGLL